MNSAKQKLEANTTPAASLYFGKVMHARLKPKVHRFNYKIFSLVIDLDRFEEATKSSWLFAVNKPSPVSFHEKDHGQRDGSPLREHIDNLLAEGDIERPAKVTLWCNPRILGYTFNPLSIYFCYDDNENIIALVYQVNNTFGQSHSYVAQVANDDEISSPAIRNSANKCFYVSPFLDMDMRYDFRIQPPNEKLRIRILEHDENGPILSATFAGDRRLLKTSSLVYGIIKTIGLTWKITAGIHYEALLLWFKGIKLRSRPIPPQKASYIGKEQKIVAGE